MPRKFKIRTRFEIIEYEIEWCAVLKPTEKEMQCSAFNLLESVNLEVFVYILEVHEVISLKYMSVS